MNTALNTPNGVYDLFKGADKYLVGFDRMFDRLIDAKATSQWNSGGNYPPYNIVRNDETTYLIEMAVAGFEESDIDIEVSGDLLYIRGEKAHSTHPENAEYLYKGLALRNFARTFTLSENVEVKSAEIDNGVLTVHLERISESNDVRKIKVIQKSDAPKREFLTENRKE